jgi:hypothetical protein
MSRPGVTLEDVRQAAEAIQAQGERPTVERVRAMTAGSASTVLRHLQTLRAEAETQPATAGTDTPEPAQVDAQSVDADRAAPIAEAIRALALVQVEAAIASERQRWESERRVLVDSHRAEVTALHDATQSQAQAAEADRKAAADLLAEFSASADNERAEAEARIEALELELAQEREAAGRLVKEAADIRAELVQTQADLGKATAVLAERQTAAAAALDRAERDTAGRLDAERRAAGAEAQAQAATERAAREESRVEQMRTALIDLERRLARCEGATDHRAKTAKTQAAG